MEEGKAAATGEVVRVEEMVAVEKGGATMVEVMTVATVEEMRAVEAGAAMAVAKVEAVKAAATGEVVRVE